MQPIYSGNRRRWYFNIVGIDGAPADPTAVTVTVTAPDGTVTTPTAVRTVTGTYYVDITFDQSGTWQARPFGTGTVVTASRMAQTVLP